MALNGLNPYLLLYQGVSVQFQHVKSSLQIQLINWQYLYLLLSSDIFWDLGPCDFEKTSLVKAQSSSLR